jgi:nucleoside-diphosphate-sugar epimerase
MPILARLEDAGAAVISFSHHDEVRAAAASLAPDVTFHLATKYVKVHHGADLEALLDANVVFGAQLLEGLSGTRGVVVSTMSFFQYLHNEPAAYSLYSATKQAFSDISRYYRDSKDVDLREVVLYDTFGPGDTRDKLVPRLVEAISTNTHVGMGPEAQPLNLLYVDDVVTGLLAVADAQSEERVALRAPANITVGELVSELEVVAGHRLSKSFNNDAAINSLVTEAGIWNAPQRWEPRVELGDALRATYDWYRRTSVS